MKNIFSIACAALSLHASAQTVRIVTTLPGHTDGNVYIAGNFNNWNPADERYRLQPLADGRWSVTLAHSSSAIVEFKFTRGQWSNCESAADGGDIANRSFHFTKDTLVNCHIAGWKDGFAKKPVAHTASPQVTVMDTAFFMPQLNRRRRIWLYLPKTYQQDQAARYPVLYMHDGQNLFDKATSFAGEWGVDEWLDSLQAKCIVVGIDNGGDKRMTEYNPNTSKQFGAGEGRAYLAFIAETLKPYIDAHYRTDAGQRATFIAGSSMGGLISFYAGIYYPNTFGGIGVFSPSFWLAPNWPEQVKAAVQKSHALQRYYFYAGGVESRTMVKDMKRVAEVLRKDKQVYTEVQVNEQGAHNEESWQKAFPAFYHFLFPGTGVTRK